MAEIQSFFLRCYIQDFESHFQYFLRASPHAAFERPDILTPVVDVADLELCKMPLQQGFQDSFLLLDFKLDAIGIQEAVFNDKGQLFEKLRPHFRYAQKPVDQTVMG